ncbi:MAG: arsenate reductase (glutaredoxin) [Gammaproteobacteria bacterium]
MNAKIYHNPRCSKSRQTLQLLEEQNVDIDVIEYLQNPPDVATLENILIQLGIEPRQLMRHKEPEYQALGLDNPTLDRAALLEAMVRTPKLIERPIVITDKGIAIGRPPENILKVL